jgi:hypothetical protein
MELSRKLTEEELSNVQEMTNEFNRLKLAIGDLELNKQGLFKRVDTLKIKFDAHEKILIEKYGMDAVINIQTGQVTKKENDPK